MKKYMKQLALSVLTLCMIFTLASGNVANAASIKPGDSVQINYIGVNLNYRGNITETSTGKENKLGKKIVLPENPNETGLLINPTANITDFYGLKNENKDVIYDSDHTLPDGWPTENKYFVDKEGKNNTYYGYVTEQIIDGQIYQLVGWKIVGKSVPYKISGKQYIKEYSNYKSIEDAQKDITFTHNQMIGFTEWEKALQQRSENYSPDERGKDNQINLLAVYIPKVEEPIDFGGGTYDYDGTSKWDVKLPKLEDTSKEITSNVYVDKNTGENVIRFTIPEGYNEDSIQLTMDDELVQLFAFRFGSAGAEIEENGKSVANDKNRKYEGHKQVIDKPGTIKDKEYYDILPGSVGRFKIEIVNKSDNVYGYEKGTLDIRTPNLDFYRNSTGYPAYTKDALDYTGSKMRGFDGQTLLIRFTPTRIKNVALHSLLGNETTSVLVNDEKLGNKLNTLFKNDKGIGNLNKYYIDFYNREFSKNNPNFVSKTKIEDFNANEIKKMFIDAEHSSMKRETNKEVAETLYNYYYNEVFGVAPSKDISNNGALNIEYSIGNFMRNRNESFEKYMLGLTSLPLSLNSETKNASTEWAFKIDGEKCFNIYNNMDYGFEMGFKLEKKVGDVTVEKHIELGDFDKDNTPTFMFKLTDVNGNTYFKTISFNVNEDKKTDKQEVFKDIPYGKYTVEEIDPIRYEVLGQPILEGVLDDVKQSGYVHYVNTKVKDNDFSDTNLVINSFKKGDNSIEISKKEHNNGKRG